MQTKNKLIPDIINRLTVKGTQAFSEPKCINILGCDDMSTPVFVVGMFRSGTSITTRILHKLGGDLGPPQHILQGKGARKQLNPDGFYENYLFMEYSQYVFKLLGKWGHNPPTDKEIENFEMPVNQRKKFINFAIREIHDDRISNLQKLKLLRSYSPDNILDYIPDHFKGLPIIKNPHFSVMPNLIKRLWPKARFLVVFRDPVSTLKSAQQVAGRAADENLYKRYYNQMLHRDDAVFWSFNSLLKCPEESIKALCNAFELKSSGVEKARKLLRVSKADTDKSTISASNDMYDAMLDLSINAHLSL